MTVAPPDPRTREPDPPPDPMSRYGRACPTCWAPVHDDQVACLNCGARVEDGDGAMGIRRAALGSATALLVLGSAVGAAVAGLPHGKDVSKPAVAQVFGKKKPLPPATAGTNGTAGTPGPVGPKPLKPLPDLAKKPPAISHVKPAASSDAGKATASNSGGNGTGTSGGSNSGGNTNNQKKKNQGKKHGHKKPPPKDTGPALYADGTAPASAELFKTGAQGPTGGTDRTIDSDSKTKLVINDIGRGVMVEPASPPYSRIALISTTPGYNVSVYSTQTDPPPPDRADWTLVGGAISADARQVLPLTDPDAKHYLVWINALPATGPLFLNEIQLLP